MNISTSASTYVYVYVYVCLILTTLLHSGHKAGQRNLRGQLDHGRRRRSHRHCSDIETSRKSNDGGGTKRYRGTGEKLEGKMEMTKSKGRKEKENKQKVHEQANHCRKHC